MSDDIYYYKDQVRELQNVNGFVRRNTLGSVLNKLNWIKENGGSLEHAIEAVRSMMKD